MESCQTHNTQMSIMSNVLNKRTMINTEHEIRWQLIYKRRKLCRRFQTPDVGRT